MGSLLAGVPARAQLYEYIHPDILSFEEGTAPFEADDASRLSVSGEHYKHLTHSLAWQWQKPHAAIRIQAPIKYLAQNPNPKETSVSTFVFWLYAKQAYPGKRLRFEFLKAGKLCCWFDCGLDFTGWRGAWVAFGRDMEGHPEEGMDEMRVIAPDVPQGELWLDHIILSSFQDVRYHTPGFQVPFVNAGTQVHWLILLQSWYNQFDLPVGTAVSERERQEIADIENRLKELLMAGKKPMNLEKLRSRFQEYEITENPDGTLRGKSIFFTRYAETYVNLGRKERYSTHYQKDNRTLRKYNDFLYQLALAWNQEQNSQRRQELEEMFLVAVRHLLDQGFQSGSEMGTLHHLGYSMRNFYTAPFLMKDVLVKAGLDSLVQQAMEWFSGCGEVKLKPQAPGIDIDAFNTSLIGRLAAILMMKDVPEKVTYLHSFSRWADNGLKYAPGTAPCFKVDGTIYHHRNHYPAYAVGGLDGAVNAVCLLNRTSFAISPESHAHLKYALLTMRRFCNLQTWPLSVSGRHPTGQGKLNPLHYAQLAMAGTPDGKDTLDRELAAAYLRLIAGEENSYTRFFHGQGVIAEKAPQGNWALNYSTMAVHRRNDWLVTAKGHSRYLWNAEIYLGANLYGRYLNFGNLEIIGSGDPISVKGSGFRQEGWDWRYFPGTTATVIPLEKMKATVLNVDTCSGYEEMLMSDETFAGAVSIQGSNGAFGMKLHDHDKYDGTLKARKSYFFFDNRVIALGSGIESGDAEHPTRTTLFQNYLSVPEEAIEANGTPIVDFPFEKTYTGSVNRFRDNDNNVYWVRNANVGVSRRLQHSYDQSTALPAQNNFALAYIDHGKAPQHAEYEYLVLIQPSLQEEKTWMRRSPYRIIQQDRNAHIVEDLPSQTTGYVFFEAGSPQEKGRIEKVSLPCLAMIHATGKSFFTLSVCDPDLRFYEGKADEIFDAQGKRMERSIYSRDWIDRPSQASTVEVTLEGDWKLVRPVDYCRIIRREKGKTVLAFICQDGFSREVDLEKAR